jgi:hypothetical protein
MRWAEDSAVGWKIKRGERGDKLKNEIDGVCVWVVGLG